jgi:hypothetical protein
MLAALCAQTGVVMIIDKGADDEVLVLRSFGIQINIASLIDHINSNEGLYQVCECATSRLLEVNRTDGINRELLTQMPEYRSNQPILVAAIDEYEWIIDGNHRLLKRAELGKESTCYISINGPQLDPYVTEFSWR